MEEEVFYACMIPLEEARKDVCHNTEEPYNYEKNKISEWEFVAASHAMSFEDEFSEEKLMQFINYAKARQKLDSLVEEGLVNACWDEEQGCVVYNAK